MFLPERKQNPAYSTITLKREHIPLHVRALATDQKVKDNLVALHMSGAQVNLQQLRRTTEEVRELVHGAANPSNIIQQALHPSLENDGWETDPIRKITSTALIFSAHNEEGKPLTERQQVLLTQLNEHPLVRAQREKQIWKRFTYDRPKKVKKRFTLSGGIASATSGIAQLAEQSGDPLLKTTGFILTQVIDDAVNIAVIPATERGGEKKLRQILKESKSLTPILPAVIGLDYYFIPQMLESSSLSVRMAGGLLFSMGAIAGSLGANILHLRRTGREIKKTIAKTTALQRFKKSWEDHISDPFRRKIWWGAGASLITASGTAALHLLAGKEYSAFLQTVIGMMESLPAFAGLFLDKPIASLKEYVQDSIKVVKAKEPINIFPSEK